MDNKTINFAYDSTEFSINIPLYFQETKITQTRKLLQHMTAPWMYHRNREAIRETLKCLRKLRDDQYMEWQRTSKVYNDEYRDPKWSGNPKATKQNNDKLGRAVNGAKKKFETYSKMSDELIAALKKNNQWEE